jgi:hypothetical protein
MTEHRVRSLGLVLQRCPFCGGEAAFEEVEGATGIGVMWNVNCIDESCIGWMLYAKFNTRGDAAAAWNKRHVADAPLRTQADAALDALPKALESNARLRRGLTAITELPRGSQGAFRKFTEAVAIAAQSLDERAPR